MTDNLSQPCTAFAGMRKIAQGPLVDVALALKAMESELEGSTVQIFDDANGKAIDLDLRGDTAAIVGRLARTSPEGQGRPGPGRPKLGVVAREVTLLPRHWEWLALQPGGASQALRRLVDEARRADEGQTEAKLAQERAYRFMSSLAGDLPGFEEAARALFRGDKAKFALEIAPWPADVSAHVLKLAGFAPEEQQSDS